MIYNEFMRRMMLFWGLFGAVLIGQAQLWEPLGGGCSDEVHGFYSDTYNHLLYVVGAFNRAGDSLVCGIATWDGQRWGAVGKGTGDTLSQVGSNPIQSVVGFNGQLFVGGMMYFMQGDWNIKFISRWDGAQWNVCGNPNSPGNLNVTNGRLFALGGFTEISGHPTKKIAVWDGNEWVQFGDTLPFDQYWGINQSEFYKGQYYFAGNFTLPDGLREIMRWDGADWLPLDMGVKGGGWVDEIAVYQDQLFVGGYFRKSSGNAASFLMAWDGTRWYDPLPDVQFVSQVKELEIIDGILYIAGEHHIWDGAAWSSIHNLARYDGQSFCSFGGGDITPLQIAGLDSELYVACQWVVASDTIKYIAKWLGGDSTDICISQPVRIQDPAAPAPLVSLAPNPAQSHITLALPQGSAVADLQIHDVAGRLVVPTQRYRAGEQVEVAALPAGLYFVEVRMRGRVEVLKMIKE